MNIMQKTTLCAITLLMLSGCYEALFARGWQTATTVNGRTKPISAGLGIPMIESTGAPTRAGISGGIGGIRDFDIVISQKGYPDGIASPL